MSFRFLACAGLFLAASLQAQKTADGRPDLQGVWTNATVTPLERPKGFESKPTLNDAEALQFEKGQAKELADVDGKSESPLLAAAGSNGTGGYNVLFIDRGTGGRCEADFLDHRSAGWESPAFDRGRAEGDCGRVSVVHDF